MKLAVFAGLALFTGAAMAAPAASSGHAGVILLAHAHGHQGGQHGHGTPGHHHGGVPAASQEAIAAMPVSTSVAISDCWIRHLPLPAPSAGYFTAANQGAKMVVLTGAASARYGDVMLHQTTHSEGMSRMSSVGGVEIAAGDKLEFKPGSYHIMLEKPVGEIKVGQSVPMQFLLAGGEKALADCQVKPANTVAP